MLSTSNQAEVELASRLLVTSYVSNALGVFVGHPFDTLRVSDPPQADCARCALKSPNSP